MGKSDVEKAKVAAKSKKEKSFFPTKVVIRRLPPSLTEEKLKECLGVLPEYDFFYFVDGKLSFEPVLFSRAYINFTNPDDIIKFRDEFDGFVFMDDRGQYYPAVVEYAPFQGIPKKKNRKDPKCNSIEQDKDYLTFLESLQQEVEPLPSMETHLEEIEARKEKNADKTTPLLEYLKMKRSNRAASRLGTGKKRQEREETPKTLKKNLPSKDSKPQPSRDDKNKSLMKKVDNRDTGRRDQNRKEDEKKSSRDKKDSPSEKDSKSQRNQREREREGKNRPESGRLNSRADDRRHGNRRDRPESERRDNTDSSKGRDDRGRRFNDRYSDDRRRDNPPNENRSSGSKNIQSSAKGRDKDKEENAKKQEYVKDHIGEHGTKDRREQEREREARRREIEREKEAIKGVKNKDRPDRAIYQPRSRTSRSDSADQSGKAEAKVSPEKTQESENKDRDKEKRENKDRDPRDKNRERFRDRDRDRRGDRRDRDRDKGRDKDRDRERDKERERQREKERDRERERARKRDRDRREKERDSPKEQGGSKSETSTKDTITVKNN